MSQRLANLFAKFVGRLSPDLRARMMRGWIGRIVVGLIFGGMKRAFDPRKAEGVDLVVHWEIADRDRGADRWQVVITDGRCKPGRKLDSEPAMTIRLERITFLELAAGITAGPVLFVAGKLKIEGDLGQAPRLPTLFRIPQPGPQPG